MILGIGVDSVSIERAGKLSDAAVRRFFAPQEVQEYFSLKDAHPEIRAQFLASRFAVKEAYAKARGLGFAEDIVLSEICVVKDNAGCPFVKLSGKTAERAPKCRIHLSITHEAPLATAFVVLETEEDIGKV
ncbi:MAG: holo-ACP synthase [Sphaerochaetaceae bacterium]|mgnify:CR=1 FL=1|nr:holo-ACP synthase [Sphaerochaetaceae bacterium]